MRPRIARYPSRPPNTRAFLLRQSFLQKLLQTSAAFPSPSPVRTYHKDSQAFQPVRVQHASPKAKTEITPGREGWAGSNYQSDNLKLVCSWATRGIFHF